MAFVPTYPTLLGIAKLHTKWIADARFIFFALAICFALLQPSWEALVQLFVARDHQGSPEKFESVRRLEHASPRGPITQEDLQWLGRARGRVLSHIFKTDGHPANSCGRWFQDVSHVAAYFRLVVPHKKNPQQYNHSKAFLLPGNLLLQWKIAMLNRQVTENHHTKWAYMGIFHSHFQLVTSGGGVGCQYFQNGLKPLAELFAICLKLTEVGAVGQPGKRLCPYRAAEWMAKWYDPSSYTVLSVFEWSMIVYMV